MVVLRALALMCVVLLAGCGKPTTAVDEVDEDAAPVLQAVITVSSGNATLPATNGTITLQLGASATFDAAGSIGSNLLYAWEFGNTTSSDVEIDHTFTSSGLHNVSLTVTSGNATSIATLAVDVPAPPASVFVTTESLPFSGDLPLGNPNSPMNAGVDYNDHPVAIVDAIDGQPVVAQQVRLILDGSGATATDMYLYWRSGTTNVATDAGTGLDKTLVVDGPVAPGDYAARVRLWMGAQASYDLTVEVDYWTAV